MDAGKPFLQVTVRIEAGPAGWEGPLRIAVELYGQRLRSGRVAHVAATAQSMRQTNRQLSAPHRIMSPAPIPSMSISVGAQPSVPTACPMRRGHEFDPGELRTAARPLKARMVAAIIAGTKDATSPILPTSTHVG